MHLVLGYLNAASLAEHSVGGWSEWFVWLHIVSDALICLAYLTIPIGLFYLVRRRRDVPFPGLFWLFGGFILLCGLTHLLAALVPYHSFYRLQGALKLLTALASWATVVALVRVIPRALTLRGPEELELLVQKRTAELGAANARLRQEIHDRTQAEQALRISSARYRRLVESNIIGVGVADFDGNFIEANDAFLHMLGYSRHELRAGKIRSRQLTPAEYHGHDEQASLACQASGICTAYEKEYLHKDGSRVPVLTRFARLDKEPALVIVTVVDLTERKRVDQELRAQARELAEADRRKDEFLATLAHELRNPLAPLRYALQIMRLAGDNAAMMDQARDMMERQLIQMVRLIDDLLDISRIGRNKLELRKASVELASVVHNAVETSRPMIEAAGHELTLSLPTTPVLLDADAARLAQVFANLLNNAAKYTEPGGRIWLTASVEGVRRQESGVRDQEQNAASALTPDSWSLTPVVEVRVRDSGVGIPEHMLPHVFDMFMQADHTLAKAQGGLGIGLTLVRRLVELHGGTVAAHSQGPGQGTEFIVRLPTVRITPGSEPEQPKRHVLEQAASYQGRILVVDDDADSAECLSLMLKIRGNEVCTARDGLEALSTARTFQPKVVLMDIGMPILNGYEAASRIRQQPWGKHMVLIALTGWGQEEDRLRSYEAGFNFHLTKPVDPPALAKLLEDLPAPT